MLVLTYHNPGLRDGNSAAGAGIAQIRTRIEVAPINRMNSPVSGHIAGSVRTLPDRELGYQLNTNPANIFELRGSLP